MDNETSRAIGLRGLQAYEWLRKRRNGASMRELRDALRLGSRQQAWQIFGRLERAGLAYRREAQVGGDPRIYARQSK